MRKNPDTVFVDVDEGGRPLGVSRSTVWRLIRRGALPSVRQRGRRLIARRFLAAKGIERQRDALPPFTLDHPIFRLVGAGRGGRQGPGAREKHALLDR